MHELSIADALLRMVQQHVPSGSTVRSLVVRAGPLRAIEPTALEWAWQATTQATAYAGSKITVEQLPWCVRCPDCGRQWEAQDVFEVCTCGGKQAHPVGGDELSLVSIEIDE